VIFGKYLKALRISRGLTAGQVAETANIHIATVYKAEKGDNIRWETVRLIYGPLCRTDTEKANLMVRWAISLDPEFVAELKGDEAMKEILQEDAQDANSDSKKIASLINRLTDQERGLLVRFCEIFADRPATRNMAQAWLDAFDHE